MSVVKLSWQGNPFENMSQEDKDLFNDAMNLMAMPEDHPDYKTLAESVERRSNGACS